VGRWAAPAERIFVQERFADSVQVGEPTLF